MAEFQQVAHSMFNVVDAEKKLKQAVEVSMKGLDIPNGLVYRLELYMVDGHLVIVRSP